MLGWLVAGFFMMVAVYGGHNRGVRDVNCDNCNEWSVEMDAMFFTLYRSLFAAGVCWMIFACCSGYGGKIAKAKGLLLLFSVVFQPLEFSAFDIFI